MYLVYSDTYCLHDDGLDLLKIVDARLENELNKAGSFEFTIYDDHPYYDKITKMKSIIRVYRDDEVIFRGRVLNEAVGIHGEKQVSCEGELAFLLDSMIAPFNYDREFSRYLRGVISLHNAKVGSEKQFTVGNITVGDFTPFNVTETEYKSAWQLLNEKMVNVYGGYLSVRYSGETRYIDYLSPEVDMINVSNQPVKLGYNITDINVSSNSENVFTAIIPLGAEDEMTKKRIDIKTVNGGLDYIYNSVAVEKYGLIFKVVIFDNITSPSALLTQAMSYLADNYEAENTVEVTACDMSCVDSSVDPFRLGQYVDVYSEKHFNTNPQRFLIKKLTINLFNPIENRIVIGSVKKGITDEVGSSASSANAQQPYVIDGGNSGIWTWRKYSDGTAECFGKIAVSGEAVNAVLGNWYRSNALYANTAHTYPITFTSIPVVNMDFQTTNSSGGLCWFFSDSATNAQKYLPQCYIIRPTQASNVNGNICIHVKGNY